MRPVFREAVFEASELYKKRAIRSALAVSGGTLKNTPKMSPDAFDA